MSDPRIDHPQPDEDGRKVRLRERSCEANLDRLLDPLAELTFVPGSACSGILNGVLLSASTYEQIGQACRQVEEVIEPSFSLPAGRRAAAGAIVQEPDGRIWLVAPSNGFDGYNATFPKGRAEPGISLQATAIREVWEASGLYVTLTACLGDFVRTQTFAGFYVTRRIGGHPAEVDGESQAVHLVTPACARELLNRETDHVVLDAVARADERASSSGG